MLSVLQPVFEGSEPNAETGQQLLVEINAEKLSCSLGPIALARYNQTGAIRRGLAAGCQGVDRSRGSITCHFQRTDRGVSVQLRPYARW